MTPQTGKTQGGGGGGGGEAGGGWEGGRRGGTGGARGGGEGARGGGEGDHGEGVYCLPAGPDRFEGAPREAAEVAAAEAAAVAIEVTGATDGNGQAEGRAGNEHASQESGERESGERRSVCPSQAAGVSDAAGDGGGGDDDDFSVSYALHYPNEFADPALEKEDLTVGEHVDPSLFVAEPCCGVEGLEILDRASKRSGRGGNTCIALARVGRGSSPARLSTICFCSDLGEVGMTWNVCPLLLLLFLFHCYYIFVVIMIITVYFSSLLLFFAIRERTVFQSRKMTKNQMMFGRWDE